MALSCDTRGCTKPVAHADRCHDRARGWCEEHTLWSGHFDDCPEWCTRVLEETGTVPARTRTKMIVGGPLEHASSKMDMKTGLAKVSCCPPANCCSYDTGAGHEGPCAHEPWQHDD